MVCNIIDGVLTSPSGKQKLKRPAVFINIDEGIIYDWGEYPILAREMKNYEVSYKSRGLMLPNFGVFELTNLTPKQQWYVITRMVTFKECSFIQDFAVNVGEYNDIEWLNAVMIKNPL